MAERTWVAFRSDARTMEYLARRGIQPQRLALEAFERQVRSLQMEETLATVRRTHPGDAAVACP